MNHFFQSKFLIIFISLFASSLCVNADFWLSDFDQAKLEAVKQNRRIVIVFQGSDWCAPCMKLERNIWSSETFQSMASGKFVFVKVDFPRRHQLSDSQKTHNSALADQYNQRGYFPLVVVTDSAGRILGECGYERLSPRAYFEKLNQFNG